jgi:hypothetical protein
MSLWRSLFQSNIACDAHNEAAVKRLRRQAMRWQRRLRGCCAQKFPISSALCSSMLRWLLVLLAAVLTVKAQALARLLRWAVNAVASKELAKGLHNAGLTNCDDRVNILCACSRLCTDEKVLQKHLAQLVDTSAPGKCCLCLLFLSYLLSAPLC